MLRARAASTAFSSRRNFSDATSLNHDNLSEYFRAASEFPDLPETPPPPPPAVRINLNIPAKTVNVATQTEVTVAVAHNNDSNNNNEDQETGSRNRIITNAAAFSERRDLKRWGHMGSLTF